MSEFDEAEVLLLARKYALFNALKYAKPPAAGPVMGRLMGSHPELRSHAKKVTKLIARVVGEVSKTDFTHWESELTIIAPELLEELGEKREPEKGLPPLRGADSGVTMRFAPNPNGPPTLGSARGIIVNSEYARTYQGRFILRFDDTDPKTKTPLPDAYTWYLEDCRWLGAEPDEVILASDRIQIYYDHAGELIEKDGGYVCFCSQARFKEYKDKGKPCPHREQSIGETLDHWREMLGGALEAGSSVLRVKTDMGHSDPAIRDWVAFRIVDTPHPRPEIDSKYRVWPLLDFESAVEDHLLKITHIIRGKDLIDSEHRQQYIYKYFNWDYPRTLHWGRVKIHEFGRLSTSEIGTAIKSGKYTGWDDPRLPTIRSLRRRGIQPEALRRFFTELGVNETDIGLSMENIYSENRKMIDKIAKRHFFTPAPVRVIIKDAPPTTAKPLLHPPDKKRGHRNIPVKNEVLISHEDAKKLKNNELLRLKDLYNIKITKITKKPKMIEAEYENSKIDIIREKNGRIIHWTPPDGIKVEVLTPKGKENGIGEHEIVESIGQVVQFERYGFVRIDSIKNGMVTAYLAHK